MRGWDLSCLSLWAVRFHKTETGRAEDCFKVEEVQAAHSLGKLPLPATIGQERNYFFLGLCFEASISLVRRWEWDLTPVPLACMI